MERKTKREKELELELEGYRNRSKYREHLDNLSDEKKRAILIVVLLFAVSISIYFYVNIKSLTEDKLLSEESYEELIESVSGNSYNLSNKGRAYLEEVLSLPGLKKRVYIYASGTLLQLEFKNDLVSVDYPFHLEEGKIKGMLNERDATLFFSESVNKEGSSLTLLIDKEEFELTFC